MREIRTSGSEGGGTGSSTSSSYPYRPFPPLRTRLAPPSSARIMAASGRCAGRKRTVCGPQTDGAAGANAYDGRQRTVCGPQTDGVRWAEAEFVGG